MEASRGLPDFRGLPKTHLKAARIEELALHINDSAFADLCVDAFVEIAKNPTRQ